MTVLTSHAENMVLDLECVDKKYCKWTSGKLPFSQAMKLLNAHLFPVHYAVTPKRIPCTKASNTPILTPPAHGNNAVRTTVPPADQTLGQEAATHASEPPLIGPS